MHSPRVLAIALRAMALSALVTLAACGGGGADTPAATEPATDDPIFNADNAWSGPVPAGATTVSADALRSAIASGETHLAGPAAEAAQRAAREQAFAADRATLTEAAASSPALKAWVDRQLAAADPMADRVVTLPEFGLTVPLLGPAAGLHAVAEAQRLSAQPENALAVYRTLYSLAPDAVRAQVPAPDTLAGADRAALLAARADLSTRLAAWRAAAGPRRSQPQAAVQAPALQSATAEAPTGRRQALAAIEPGRGSDIAGNASDCTPGGLAASNWFALRSFMNPAKAQGRRNTCWAFATTGALEIRERVRSDAIVDLSEQFLINKVRLNWFPNNTVESGSHLSALKAAIHYNQPFPAEREWTYNPSTNRTSITTFVDLCKPYGEGPNKGTCSDSAHQSPTQCATEGRFTICAYYATVETAGGGVAATKPRNAWVHGDPFDLPALTDLLANGVPLMATMNIYPGFGGQRLPKVTSGIVTDLSTTVFDPALNALRDAAMGQHELLIVGFLSNDVLSRPGKPSDVPGGGYFVVRNSWGCGFGDAGYTYMPAAYVEETFLSLNYLEEDGTRSAAWKAEQASPGNAEASTVTVPKPIVQADLRVPTDLAAFFTVTHTVATSVRVVITSDVEGVLFDGPWITDRFAFGGTKALHTFAATGRHLLGVQAFYGGGVVREPLAVDVVNSAPTLNLLGSGTARQGEPWAVAAQANDLNEPDPRVLCTNARWTVAPGDTLSGTSGCSQSVTFGSTGTRTVEVTTTDREGLATTATLRVDVQAPAANPYPRITSAQLFSRQLGGLANACLGVPVADGLNIDLRQTGCIFEAGQALPPRYGASVTVENPSGETLGYEWRLLVDVEGVEANLYDGPVFPTGASVVLVSPGNQSVVTKACRLALTVIAPQPERSQSRTVWSGSCTYAVGRLG